MPTHHGGWPGLVDPVVYDVDGCVDRPRLHRQLEPQLRLLHPGDVPHLFVELHMFPQILVQVLLRSQSGYISSPLNPQLRHVSNVWWTKYWWTELNNTERRLLLLSHFKKLKMVFVSQGYLSTETFNYGGWRPVFHSKLNVHWLSSQILLTSLPRCLQNVVEGEEVWV